MNSSPENLPSRGPVLSLFLAGFFCALIQLPLGIDAVGFGPPYETATVARNLAATGTFRDPFGASTGPTAHVAPVYPFLLSVLIRLLHEPAAIVWGAILVNAGLMALAGALLPGLSQRVFGRTGPGIAAAILFVFTGRLMPQWEAALAAVLLIGTTLAFLDDVPWRAGLWGGACLLANPVSLPVLMLLGIYRRRRFALVSAAVALGVCAPWIARNWIELGAPYFVRDNFGLELYISNNDKSAPELLDNGALWTEHPNQNREEAEVVARMGEGPYNRKRLEEATAWIRSHPRRFLELTAGRARNYWFPTLREGWTAYGEWLITALGLAGAWLARGNSKALLMAAASVAYSLPFLLIQTVGRYRYPSVWASALLAGYTACRIMDAVSARRADRRSRAHVGG